MKDIEVILKKVMAGKPPSAEFREKLKARLMKEVQTRKIVLLCREVIRGRGLERVGHVPRRKILSIEDEPDIQKLLRIALNCRGRYQVVTVDNGLAGLELAEKENFDLIILDALTPVMDGYETCKRLKENPTTKEIPVIFLTAKTQAKEIEKGLALGALDYLTKPFDPLELPNQIEEILERIKGSV